MNVLNLLLLILLLPLLFGYLQKLYQASMRSWLRRKLEDVRGSKVVNLIHVQPPSGVMSFLSPKYIDIKDAQRIVEEIRKTPKEKPIDIVLHTPGGLVIASQQIARALATHKGKVTAFVPFLAMSGGTLVAMAADEIVMGEQALLGRLDPQILGISAVSIINAVGKKPIGQVDDKTLVLADVAEKASEQVKKILKGILLKHKYNEQQLQKIIDELVLGKYTHDYPIHFEEAKELGINVSLGQPELVYNLLETYFREN